MAYFRKRENWWEYRISYKAPDGSYKQKSKYGFRTKSEAVQSASQAEIELSNGIVEDKNITLAEYFEKWYKIHRAPSVTAGTLKHYETAKILLNSSISANTEAVLTFSAISPLSICSGS